MLVSGTAIAQPTPNFSATPLTGCPPMVVAFTDLSTGGATQWSWDFGNGLPNSTTQNPTTSYSAPGTYTVKLTVTNASGSRTLTKTNYITVNTPPTVTLSASPLAVCPGVPISFASSVTWNSAGSGTYYWDFGDGGNALTANPTHAYTTAGTYTVRLTATNSAGCPTTDTQVNYITIYPSPPVSFYATDTAICSPGGSTTFFCNTTGTGLTYTWNFGDGSSPGSGSPVTHAYSSIGTYTVRLSITNSNGCTDSVKYNNYIRVRSLLASANVPASACQSSTVPVNSTATTTAGALINWDFGDGSGIVSGPIATHFYSSSGTFAIRMFATIGGCTDTDTHVITINPRPNTSFTYSPANPCPSPVTVSFTNTTSLSGSSSWSFGDGFTSAATSPAHVYTWDSTFPVKLTVTTAFGCSATIYDTVRVYPGKLYIADPNSIPANSEIFEGCFPYTATPKGYLSQPPTMPFPYPLYPFPIVSQTWDFGDGSATNSSTISPTHIYPNTGTYPCALSVTSSNGCTFYDTAYVHVGGHSTVNFYAVPRPACAGSTVMFFDSSFSIYGPITGWQWDFGDSVNYGIGNPTTNIYKKPGYHSVTLITSQNGCHDTLTKVNYLLINPPASIPKVNVDCNTTGLVHFADSSIGATSILWYFGDGTTSTINHTTHTYALPGVYIASLVAWNSTTGCKDSQAVAVIINNYSVSIKASDSSICFGDTLYLTPVITGAAPAASSVGAVTWNWNQGSSAPFCCNFGPFGSKGNRFIASAFWNNPRGQYNVVVGVQDNNGCVVKQTLMNFLTVGGPTAGFTTTPKNGCAPANVVLTSTSTFPTGTSVLSNYWDYGDGTTGTTPFGTINHYYPNVGSYGISLKVTDNLGCTDSIGIPNYLTISRPIALFSTLGAAACAGTAYTFYSSSTGNNITHQWSFGDGGTSTASSPSHTYTSAGSYPVRLIVTDAAGCKDTAFSPAPLTVSPQPSASFTMDDTINICPPLIVNFTNTSSGGAVYANWNFGNGGGSTMQNPATTYTAPGLYTIRLIATNSVGCTDTAYGTARVLGYRGAMSYAPLKGCAPLAVHFQANNVPGVAGFIYDFGDGTTSATTASSITHVYTAPGPHLPKITMTDNLGCSATSLGIDTIKVDGVYAGFTFTPFPACNKGTIQFRDTSRGAYSQINPVIWMFHDGTTSSAANPSKTYPGPGKYAVTLFGSTTTGCVDTFRSQVIFYPLPTINAGNDTTICVSDAAILRPRGGASYTWSPAGTLSCANCTNPFATPTVATTYTVIGTDTNGCTNKDTVVVKVKYKTITDVTGSGTICSGDTVQFVAIGASTYQWDPPTGLSDPTSSQPYAYPMLTQHYTLVSRLAGCIPDTDYVELIVHPTPTVDAGTGQTMIAGNTIHLEATGTGIITEWLWSPSEGIWAPLQPSTDAAPKRTTLYTIKATTEFGCFATDTVRIVVLCDNSQVYLPNTFTPDGNGVNDVFYPRGKGIANIDHFRIYDRWGELVFERANIAVDDKNNGWHGDKGGKALSPDIYVYMVEATCDTGEPIKWQGDVMLLR